ncbi:hypothetical protein [Vibrio hibernica]|uniref:hypothetical protein n=1 Tax=Vibrio hibernica TaxID=2587465 RepID=UPI00187E2472|nr:hypothetical protein [Vibrio hibernica]
MINIKHISLAVLLGAVVGGGVTYNTVAPTHEELQQKNSQQQDKTEELQTSLSKEIQAFEAFKLASKSDKQKIQDLTAEIEKLKQTQKSVENTLAVQKKKSVTLKTENKELAKTTELQSGLYQQSHELFSKQEALQKDIAKMSATRDKLVVQTKNFTEQCKLFKEGTSWDPKSDSCDNEKLAIDQTKKLNNSLSNKQKELNEVQALIKKLGIKPDPKESAKS